MPVPFHHPSGGVVWYLVWKLIGSFVVQKYRLHNRRSSPGAAAAPVSQSIMLVDGVWAAQEQSSGSQSGSRQGPLQFSRPGVAVDGGDNDDSSSSDEDDDKLEDGYSLKCV